MTSDGSSSSTPGYYVKNSPSYLLSKKRHASPPPHPYPAKRLSLSPLTNRIVTRPTATKDILTQPAAKEAPPDGEVLRTYTRYLQWEWVAIRTEKCLQEKATEIKREWHGLRKMYDQAQVKKRLKEMDPYDQDTLLHEWRAKYLAPIRSDLKSLIHQNDLPKLSDYTRCERRLEQAKAQLERMERYMIEDDYREEMDKVNRCSCLMTEMKKEYLDIRYKCATWNLN
ncbi:hypothetical protein BC940DRAFT_308737 [Gongronella butleri]|nr:hypothetical protein BC940DRAFT_308737 [Gongronella butleri]